MKIIDYDTKKYNFAELIGGLFNVDLSELDSEEQKTNLTLGMDTHTSLHKVFAEHRPLRDVLIVSLALVFFAGKTAGHCPQVAPGGV